MHLCDSVHIRAWKFCAPSIVQNQITQHDRDRLKISSCLKNWYLNDKRIKYWEKIKLASSKFLFAKCIRSSNNPQSIHTTNSQYISIHVISSTYTSWSPSPCKATTILFLFCSLSEQFLPCSISWGSIGGKKLGQSLTGTWQQRPKKKPGYFFVFG